MFGVNIVMKVLHENCSIVNYAKNRKFNELLSVNGIL